MLHKDVEIWVGFQSLGRFRVTYSFAVFGERGTTRVNEPLTLDARLVSTLTGGNEMEKSVLTLIIAKGLVLKPIPVHCAMDSGCTFWPDEETFKMNFHGETRGTNSLHKVEK